MNRLVLKLTYLLVFLFVLYTGIFAYNYTLNVDLMEARNFTTAREMIENHNWLIPSMNGEPRIVKPPLPTWLTSFAMLESGTDTNLMYNRIPVGLSALLTIVFTFLFTKSYTRRFSPAFYSAVILATSYMFMFMARKGTWDMFCHCFMMGAIWSLYEGLKSNKRLWFISAGVLMALSWMSKGPVSFYTILLPFLICYPLFHGVKEFAGKWKGLLAAAIVCVLLSIIWPAYLLFHIPGVSAQVLNKEIEAWGSRHIKPIWYYIQFPFMAGIWFIPAVAMLIPTHAIRKFRSNRSYFFLISWVVLEVILLTIVPEKKDRYLLPVAITMAIPLACYISSFFDSELGRAETYIIKFYRFFIYFCLAASIPLTGYTLATGGLDIFTAVICGVSVLTLLLFFKFDLDKKLGLFILLPMVFSLLICSAAPVGAKFSKTKDFMELINVRNLEELKVDTIYSDHNNMKIVWAIDRKIRILDNQTAESLAPESEYIFMTDKTELVPLMLDPVKYSVEEFAGDRLAKWHFYKFRKVPE